MLTMDALQAFGANTAEGVSRCFGKEDFYLRLVKMVVSQNQKDFDQLDASIKAGTVPDQLAVELFITELGR